MDKKDKFIQVSVVNKGLNPLVFKLFHKDSDLFFIFKKTEKIAAALFLVTNLMSDTEPLKTTIRNLGARLISKALSLTGNPKISFGDPVKNLLLDFVEITALLEVSYLAGSVSEMNYKVISQEIERIVKGLSVGEEDGERGGIFLAKDFFEIDGHKGHVEEGGKIDEKDKNFDIQQNDFVSRKKQVNTQSGPEEIYKGQMAIKPKIVERKRGRRDIILEILGTKSNLTVKDFSSVIAGCSEKTIQRELLSLVSEGVLKKEGERRWSRYSLS
ncbi:MAG: hypothetical protein Q8P86_03140 [bacterium]|nr:hypothetical protein [bacterium]